jgi:hypothetical protein
MYCTVTGDKPDCAHCPTQCGGSCQVRLPAWQVTLATTMRWGIEDVLHQAREDHRRGQFRRAS